MAEKVYILFAGVNGAGKSTLYHSDHNIANAFSFSNMKDFQNLKRVNTDEIVKDIGDWRNFKDVFNAGRIAIQKINNFFANGESFCQETTLCGKSILRNIDISKKHGYKVGLIYVGVDNVEVAKNRVRKRVENGGHGIPEEDIERRYVTSLSNIKEILYKCDEAIFIDNTVNFRMVAFFNYNELHLLNDLENPPIWFTKYLGYESINKCSVSKNIHNNDKRDFYRDI